ncbi:MAG: sigma-54 interaction domain-containing protein [Candidatus Saccharibacteria bacterium]
MADNQEKWEDVLRWLTNALDELGGLVIVDKNSRIVFISARYAEYLLDTSAQEAIGKPLQKYISQNDLVKVLQTGIPKLGTVWSQNGRSLIVSLLPLTEKGIIIGAMGVTIFPRLEEAVDFARRIIGEDTQLDYYKEEVKRLWGAKYSFESIRGSSLAIVEAKRRAWDIAATHSPVLIIGDTGTGKELFAHAIHVDSPKKDGPFVVVNCAGIPDNLVESELFGYEDGAFTGAKKGGKPGKFEMAHNGTLFLDEVAELPLHVQAKLLRVLQEHEIERVGGTTLIRIKVRVISATNVDLEDRVARGLFREDLYYRLNVFSVTIPPLIKRMEDIPALSHFFITSFNQEAGTKVTGLSEGAQRILRQYNWPGNVRELKSTIERACLDAKMGLIQPGNLYYITDKIGRRHGENPSSTRSGRVLSLKEITDQTEKEAILKALELTGGNKRQACEILDINRTTFYKKLKELGIMDE